MNQAVSQAAKSKKQAADLPSTTETKKITTTQVAKGGNSGAQTSASATSIPSKDEIIAQKDAQLRRLRANLKTAQDEAAAMRNAILAMLIKDRFWVFSLMKSGTTFTAIALGNYLARLQGHKVDVDFKALRQFGVVHSTEQPGTIENPEFLRDRLLAAPDQGAIFTHIYVDGAFSKVILLIRNPFDYLVSSYHYFVLNRDRDDTKTYADVIPKHMSDYAKIYQQQQNILATRPDDALQIWYDDLMADKKVCLSRMITHLGLKLKPALLDKAIAASSKDKVREMEKKYGHAIVAGRGNFVGESFVRSGKIGEWKSELSKSDIALAKAHLMQNGLDEAVVERFMQ